MDCVKLTTKIFGEEVHFERRTHKGKDEVWIAWEVEGILNTLAFDINEFRKVAELLEVKKDGE